MDWKWNLQYRKQISQISLAVNLVLMALLWWKKYLMPSNTLHNKIAFFLHFFDLCNRRLHNLHFLTISYVLKNLIILALYSFCMHLVVDIQHKYTTFGYPLRFMHHKYYNNLKEPAQHSHLGWFPADYLIHQRKPNDWNNTAI